MSEPVIESGPGPRTELWLVLAMVLVVAVASLLVVFTGPPVGTDSAANPDQPTTSTIATPSPNPSDTDEAVPPREPADEVLAPLDPGSAPTASGVAAQLQPLLANGTLGAEVGATVLDPVTDELLLDVDADGAHVPASTTKLLTALATLETIGPDSRFRTTVVRDRPDHIVLVGGGDPALSQRVDVSEDWDYPFTRFDLLARSAAEELRAAGRTSVRLGYSDDLFSGPAINPAWEAGYVSGGQVAPVSALSLDGGRTTPGLGQRARDPARYAAERFAALLVSYGIQVQGELASQPSPAGDLVAAVESPTVSEVVGQMLARSDNDVAEMLARHVARAEGIEPTFAGGGRAIADALDRLGVPTTGLALADGSGLSRQNRIAAVTLARTLETAYDDADGSSRSLLTGLPVAGFTGSLATRFDDPESVAQAGDIRAKTGYLSRVVSLAGYVVDDDGRALIFVVLADAVPPESTLDAQRTEDQVAARLAGCGCG